MEHYINNKVFLEQLNDYKEKIKSAEDDGREIPPIPDDIAISFMKIANGLGNKPNFSNYTYKDEMISDGIENCIQYCRNFDSNKSKNPFSYFTQIMRNAFLRRIEKEKKQSYIKNKLECIRNNIPYYSSIVEFERKIQERMEQNDARKRMGLERFCE